MTKGCDRAFTLRRKDAAGNLVNWDADLSIYVLSDPEDPTRIEADVDGSSALFRIESDVCDVVTNSTVFRIVMSQPGSPTLETPVMVGKFKRFDG